MSKTDMTLEEVKGEIVKGVEWCLNPSHQATINAARWRFNLNIVVPDVSARVSLTSGDSVIVMQVKGLPRLTDRHEYSCDEIDQAQFQFLKITLL
jgi:hypothetical protein